MRVVAAGRAAAEVCGVGVDADRNKASAPAGPAICHSSAFSVTLRTECEVYCYPVCTF